MYNLLFTIYLVTCFHFFHFSLLVPIHNLLIYYLQFTWSFASFFFHFPLLVSIHNSLFYNLQFTIYYLQFTIYNLLGHLLPFLSRVLTARWFHWVTRQTGKLESIQMQFNHFHHSIEWLGASIGRRKTVPKLVCIEPKKVTKTQWCSLYSAVSDESF